MDKKIFHKKMKKLLIGEKTIKSRFMTAFFPSLALSFILFFFGPLDLSYSSRSFLDYTVIDILPTSLKIWGITFVGFFLVSWIPGGKLHVWISSLFAGLAAAFYIQGNWLNIDLGVLDGTAIEWQKYGDNAIINLVFFVMILLIPFIIHFFSRKVWKHYVIFSSILLLIMQLFPLLLTLPGVFNEQAPASSHYILSKDKEYVLGNENIVVFILDQTGPEELSKTLERYPEILKPFIDFEYYDNFNSDYIGTFPAAAYLLTHDPYDWNISPSEWLDKAWHSDEANTFYNELKETGWSSRIFNRVPYIEGLLENAYGKFSNIELIDGKQAFSVNLSVYRKLIKLSFFRYFPLIMKAPFWIYTGELSGMKILSENEKTWDKFESLQKYLDNGLTIGGEEKVYITYHFEGAHAPFRIKENGRLITHENAQEIGLEGQLAGHFYVISQYIQQMKDYHVYDSSTIIITSDHGNSFNTHSIFFY